MAELGDARMIAALAMRKLQALHLLSTPGVLTTTDVVVTIVQDLDRALIQAPNMRLKLQAAATDWDAAFSELDLDAPPPGSANHPSRTEVPAPIISDDLVFGDPGDSLPNAAPVDPSQADPEAERFRALHGRLHEALFAVVEVSEGEIRYLS